MLMESSNLQLNILKEHFPQQKERIEFLYDNDPDFRTLCSDYILCLQFFQRIRGEVNEKKHSLEEYEEVKRELETEIRQYLD